MKANTCATSTRPLDLDAAIAEFGADTLGRGAACGAQLLAERQLSLPQPAMRWRQDALPTMRDLRRNAHESPFTSTRRICI